MESSRAGPSTPSLPDPREIANKKATLLGGFLLDALVSSPLEKLDLPNREIKP